MGNLVLGKGYIPGLGLCYIEDTEKKDFFTALHTRTGHRYWVARERIQWRR